MATGSAVPAAILRDGRPRGRPPQDEVRNCVARSYDEPTLHTCGEAMNTKHPALTNGAYDVARVREDFAILAMKIYGRPLIYLDNAASAQKPKAVLDRLHAAYTSEYANPHPALHSPPHPPTQPYQAPPDKLPAS